VVFVLNAEAIVEIDITAWTCCRISTRSSTDHGIASGWRGEGQDLYNSTPSGRHRELVGSRSVFPTPPAARGLYLGRRGGLDPQ